MAALQSGCDTSPMPSRSRCVSGCASRYPFVFCADAEAAPVTVLGPQLEHHPAFPGGVNVEFVQVLSARELRMRVWERGSGVTMACGTGACASTAAAVSRGYCMPDTPITVRLDGGALEITVSPDGEATMTGPAAFVYEGETIGC